MTDSSTTRQKAFFFDRDGVINVDHGYVSKIEDFEFTDGIFPVMRALSKKGYTLIVVTNQSGIGRGLYTEEDLQQLTAWMVEQFAVEGVDIAAVYSCPHAPDAGCDCRKPKPGLFLRAIQEHDIDPDVSWIVGDKTSDMQAAAAAGICNCVLLGDADPVHSTHIISKLSELLELPV